MSTDIHVYVERKNEDGNWEYLTVYSKDSKTNEYKDAEWRLFMRDYNLFDWLTANVSDKMPYPRDVPKDMSNTVKEKYDAGIDPNNGVNYYYNATWFDWVELCMLSEYCGMMPIDEDYNVETEEYDVVMGNPSKRFVRTIEMILAANDVYFPMPGEIRVVVWFDN